MTYASREQLAIYGLPAELLSGVAEATQDAHLDAATAVVRSRLLAKYSEPFESTGLDVAIATCQIAAFSILANVIGFNPGTVSHQAIVDARNQAFAWLKLVAEGKATADVVDATPEATEGTVEVYTEELRGWGDELP